jgi:hypothetical protein
MLAVPERSISYAVSFADGRTTSKGPTLTKRDYIRNTEAFFPEPILPRFVKGSVPKLVRVYTPINLTIPSICVIYVGEDRNAVYLVYL